MSDRAGQIGATRIGPEGGVCGGAARREEAPQCFEPGAELPTSQFPYGFLVVSGWVGEVVTVDPERRQVVDILLPGDAAAPPGSGHCVAALTPTSVLPFSQDRAPDRDAILRQTRRLRQQVARNGRRTARERVAHLLLELCERLRIGGGVTDGAFDLPISQAVIADAVGLSYVHVSRVLTQLERSGMIERRRGRVTIADGAAMELFCGFDAGYIERTDGGEAVAPCAGGT